MKKTTAKQLMHCLLAIDVRLNMMSEISKEIDNPAEQQLFRATIDTVWDKVYADLMTPLIRQYAELDPIDF